VNFSDSQTFRGTRTETDTYEEIHRSFNQRLNRRGVCRFLHTTAGNDCDHDRTRSGQTDTDPATEAQGRKENAAEDRGVNRGALAVASGVACADAVKETRRVSWGCEGSQHLRRASHSG
jgi:hypothetical protein